MSELRRRNAYTVGSIFGITTCYLQCIGGVPLSGISPATVLAPAAFREEDDERLTQSFLEMFEIFLVVTSRDNVRCTLIHFLVRLENIKYVIKLNISIIVHGCAYYLWEKSMIIFIFGCVIIKKIKKVKK